MLVCALTTFSLCWYEAVSSLLWIAVVQYAMIFGVIGLGFMARRHLGSLARSVPTGTGPSNWMLDQVGFSITSPISERRLDWRAVVRVLEEKDRIIFAVAPSRNYFLPTRLLTAEASTELHTLIAEAKASGRLGAGAR